MSRFGSLGTQYFDNNGDPLADGLIYFYESGTTTPKTTYADISQTTANANPVELSASGRQPNIFFSGVAKGVLATSANVQVEVRDPVGDTDASVQWTAWQSAFTYPQDFIVLGSNGTFYISLQNGNLNNEPSASPTWWQDVADYLFISQLAVGANEIAVGDATLGFRGLDVTAQGSMVIGDGTAPAELPLGTDGTFLMADSGTAFGAAWTSLPRDLETFTASGNWGKPDGVSFVMVELWGGGGGGATRSGTTGCAGGSGGEYVWGIFEASALTDTVAVTIGAGGAGGLSSNNPGQIGGASAFGSYLDALGGNPGTVAASFTTIPRSGVATTTSADMPVHPHPQAGYGGHTALAGGRCRDGGGGGGGGANGTGGTSERGGNGGAGNASGVGVSGSAPGGGGGGADNNGGGGAGARGEARIWSW
jgi:hypothetical protein